jgi:hypothetical protein
MCTVTGSRNACRTWNYERLYEGFYEEFLGQFRPGVRVVLWLCLHSGTCRTQSCSR